MSKIVSLLIKAVQTILKVRIYPQASTVIMFSSVSVYGCVNYDGMISNIYSNLILYPMQADESTIVDEAVNYIKTLQQTLQNLQKQQLER